HQRRDNTQCGLVCPRPRYAPELRDKTAPPPPRVSGGLMRQGLFQLVGTTMLASMAIAACSSSGQTGGAGGSSSSGGTGGTGGGPGSGGAGGGASPVTSLTGSKAVNALTMAE